LERGRDVQIPPMAKGMQNHVLVLSKRWKCKVVVTMKMMRKMIAGGREGT
jgi:hypothetical protein